MLRTRQKAVQLKKELYQFFLSDSLSEKRLLEFYNRYHFGPPNVCHYVCLNKKVTEGILRCILEYFPNSARHVDIGYTPVHILCSNKNATLNMVQLLIDVFPESLHHQNNDGAMPLHRLCCNENLDDEVAVDILKLLIERCPESVRHVTRKGNLPIHIAIGGQCLEFCRLLIEAYPGSERIANHYGRLPIHFACRHDTVATVKFFYQLYHEGINVADRDGRHPIHDAIWGLKNRSKGGNKVLRFLLDCKPDVLNSTGQTPLHIACGNTNNVNSTVAKLLIDAFPESIRHVNNDGWMPLHCLCTCKNPDEEVKLEILKFLLERYPESVRQATRNGNLPIHIAAAKQSPGVCRILIEAYPGSERITDYYGRLPFHWACQYNTVATAKYLYQLYPESINVADRDGRHPIYISTAGLNFRKDNVETAVEMTQFLLDCDANLVSRTFFHEKPLFFWVCKEASNEDTSRLNVYLKITRVLYDAHPEAIESNEVTSNADSFCEEVQTFINTQLTYARQARDSNLMTTGGENGQLPLHRVLRFPPNNVTLGSIKLLVKGNPSAVRTPDNAGALPLHLACLHHDSARIVEYLIGLDSNTLTAVDRERNTALHLACRGAKHATISLFLEEHGGISVSKRNARNQLPVHLLLESNTDTVRDRGDIKYLQSIYRLLRAYPETVMGAKEESK